MSNIKELIRAEIDRRYEENREKARYDDYYRGMNDGLDHFEQILDTLPDELVTDCYDLKEAAEKYADGPECSWVGTSALEQAFIAGAEWQKRKQPKVKGYGVMRKMEDPRPDDWYMDERGKEHCWGYKFNEPCRGLLRST